MQIDDVLPVTPATASWVLPHSTPGHVTGGGQIAAPGGHGKNKIAFGLEAKGGRHGVKGNCEVVDSQSHTNVDCLNATALVIDGREATIYGDAKIGRLRTAYKITVDGGGGHGVDNFRIVTSSGYLAEGTVLNGEIHVHCRPAHPPHGHHGRHQLRHKRRR